MEREPLWVDSGDVVTSAGFKTALHLLLRLAGAGLAEAELA